MGVVDLPLHVRAAFSAKIMLEEGQFILMYLNDSFLALQPEFLYHSPIGFAISGLAQILFKINAFNSILIVYAVCTVIGQILVLEHLSVNFWLALFCAAMTVISPYYITDMFQRAAIVELTAFSFLLMTLYAILKYLDSGGKKYEPLGYQLRISEPQLPRILAISIRAPRDRVPCGCARQIDVQEFSCLVVLAFKEASIACQGGLHLNIASWLNPNRRP
jgi:hypothetical protein